MSTIDTEQTQNDLDVIDTIVDVDIIKDHINNISKIIHLTNDDYLPNLKLKLQERYSKLVDYSSSTIKVKYDDDTEVRIKKMWIKHIYTMFNRELYSLLYADRLLSYIHHDCHNFLETADCRYSEMNTTARHNDPSNINVIKNYIKNDINNSTYDLRTTPKNVLDLYIDSITDNKGKEIYEDIIETRFEFKETLFDDDFCQCGNCSCRYNQRIQKVDEKYNGNLIYNPSNACMLKSKLYKYFYINNMKIAQSRRDIISINDKSLTNISCNECVVMLKTCEYRNSQSKKNRSLIAKCLLIERAIARYEIEDYIKVSLYRIIQSSKEKKTSIPKAYKIALDAAITYIKKDFLNKNKHLINFL